MRIVMIGIGQTGKELAKELLEAGHEIVVIDSNEKEVEKFTNFYDADGVVGNGASKEIQEKAKVSIADIVIALTAKDEVNIMAAVTAKQLGARYTIVRIRNEEYKKEENYFMEQLKVDCVIDAEFDTAKEISRIVSYPTSIRTGAFANGKVDVAELKVKEGSPLVDLKLTELKNKFQVNLIVASILRNGKLMIPRGDATILEEDEIYVVAERNEIYHFLKQLGFIEKAVKTVLLVGCGSIGKYLLKELCEMNIKVKVIEFDKNRCMELLKEFPNATIVHGDGVDAETLLEEKITDYDCCISLTGSDETNLVITLFAWSCKVRKLVTKINSLNYTKMLHHVEIDNTLSPHFMALSAIHRFIRGKDDEEKNGGNMMSLYRFAKNMAEAIEFEVEDSFSYLGQTLRQLKIRKDVVIAFLIRKHKIIIPNGDTTIEKRDRVIVIAAANQNIANLDEIIEVS